MGDTIRDLRHAVRSLRKAPAFTLVAVVTLALGIGVNSTVFSLVNAVLFRPPPAERPAELVDVFGRQATSTSHDAISWPNYLDYRAESETLRGLIAYSNFFASFQGGTESPEIVIGELVSDNYFDVLGVEPALGRGFRPEEVVEPGASPVAVLGHGFWRSRFGGDPGVLGRTFRMNGIVYTVVGVAGEDFGGMVPAAHAQMWIPATMADEVEPLGSRRGTGGGGGPSFLDRRGLHFLWLTGRMAAGMEVERVRSELEAITARLAERHPDANGGERVVVLRSRDVAVNPDFDRTLRPAGLVLLGAVGLVLLVACANLANMMLARAHTRRGELAVRVALGASRRHLVRRLLTESLLVSLAGGALALLLAHGLTGLIAGYQPPLPVALGLDIGLDERVFLFTLAVAVLTGIAFGLLPALRASRPDLVSDLKVAGRAAGGRRRGLDLRDALVVSQVALSVALLVGGALLVRSLDRATEVDLGFPGERIAYLLVNLDMNGYEPDDRRPFAEAAVERLRARPGVVGVARASRLPQSLNNNRYGLYLDGRQEGPDDAPFAVDGANVDEAYFDVLGLEILEGRGIEAADRDDGRRVAVVTAATIERLWPGEDVVGREFRTSWGGDPWRIVGVVEDYKVVTPGEDPTPYLHFPLSPGSAYPHLLVRTVGPAAADVPELAAEVRALDPEFVFMGTGTLDGLAEVRIYPIRLASWLMTGFAVLALLLAAVGLYGVVAYSVAGRVREIGIRKALGARPGEVARQTLRRGMTLVAVGGLLGAALAAALGTALSGVLYVGRFDPLSFLAAFALLGSVAAVANWVPARRASRVDPMVVLRSE